MDIPLLRRIAPDQIKWIHFEGSCSLLPDPRAGHAHVLLPRATLTTPIGSAGTLWMQDGQGGNPYGLDQQTFNLVTVLSVSRVRVVVENTGWLPTHVTQLALDRRMVLPLRADISLPDGASLVTGTAKQDLGQLAGRALKTSGIGMFAFGTDDTSDRAVAEWIVSAPAGTECDVTVRHDRAGIVRAAVTLT